MGIVDDALLTKEAQAAAMGGWSIEEIRRYVCVECGKIDMPDFSADGDSVPEKMPGRKIGYRKNGTRFDAGHICGDCMSA